MTSRWIIFLLVSVLYVGGARHGVAIHPERHPIPTHDEVTHVIPIHQEIGGDDSVENSFQEGERYHGHDVEQYHGKSDDSDTSGEYHGKSEEEGTAAQSTGDLDVSAIHAHEASEWASLAGSQKEQKCKNLGLMKLNTLTETGEDSSKVEGCCCCPAQISDGHSRGSTNAECNLQENNSADSVESTLQTKKSVVTGVCLKQDETADRTGPGSYLIKNSYLGTQKGAAVKKTAAMHDSDDAASSILDTSVKDDGDATLTKSESTPHTLGSLGAFVRGRFRGYQMLGGSSDIAVKMQYAVAERHCSLVCATFCGDADAAPTQGEVKTNAWGGTSRVSRAPTTEGKISSSTRTGNPDADGLDHVFVGNSNENKYLKNENRKTKTVIKDGSVLEKETSVVDADGELIPEGFQSESEQQSSNAGTGESGKGESAFLEMDHQEHHAQKEKHHHQQQSKKHSTKHHSHHYSVSNNRHNSKHLLRSSQRTGSIAGSSTGSGSTTKNDDYRITLRANIFLCANPAKYSSCYQNAHERQRLCTSSKPLLISNSTGTEPNRELLDGIGWSTSTAFIETGSLADNDTEKDDAKNGDAKKTKSTNKKKDDSKTSDSKSDSIDFKSGDSKSIDPKTKLLKATYGEAMSAEDMIFADGYGAMDDIQDGATLTSLIYTESKERPCGSGFTGIYLNSEDDSNSDRRHCSVKVTMWTDPLPALNAPDTLPTGMIDIEERTGVVQYWGSSCKTKNSFPTTRNDIRYDFYLDPVNSYGKVVFKIRAHCRPRFTCKYDQHYVYIEHTPGPLQGVAILTPSTNDASVFLISTTALPLEEKEKFQDATSLRRVYAGSEQTLGGSANGWKNAGDAEGGFVEPSGLAGKLSSFPNVENMNNPDNNRQVGTVGLGSTVGSLSDLFRDSKKAFDCSSKIDVATSFPDVNIKPFETKSINNTSTGCIVILAILTVVLGVMVFMKHVKKA